MPPILSSSSSSLPLTSTITPRTALLPRQPLSLLTTRLSSFLHRRQTTSTNPSIIPTTYGSINSGPSPGTVVGIVLGSVAGFILLLWLFYTCFTFGRVEEEDVEEVVVKKKRRGSRASAHSRRVSETVEIRTGPGPAPIRVVPPPAPPPVGRVVVEERREVRRETDYGGDDEIVVIEEPRRSKSKREKRSSREEPGYRTVDPANYGGVVGGRRR